MKKKYFNLLLLLIALFSASTNAQIKSKSTAVSAGVWSAKKANAWYKQQQWINGANFLPSTAINQLEMWQEDTFDPGTIDKELGWAQGIGFNTMRVYLHSLAWKQDKIGFKKRMDQYLSIADKHKIKTVFVFFDDCWNKQAKVGKQPEPKPGIHNSGWLQDPGDPDSKNPANFPALELYVKDVLTRFKADKRILLWDLYNEPGNSGKLTTSLPLLKSVFAWARAVNPSQPVSAGVWAWDYYELNAFQVMNSDVITYHDYEDPQWHQRVIDLLKIQGRPMICTEYMARTRNSRFENVLPILKKQNIGAINWGLVDGKSNTKYAWDTPLTSGEEPKEWFHDIFRKDGTAYKQEEIEVIKKLHGL